MSTLTHKFSIHKIVPYNILYGEYNFKGEIFPSQGTFFSTLLDIGFL